MGELLRRRAEDLSPAPPQSVYFYCVPSEDAGEVPYQHLVVALADGLSELGVDCFSNVNYWPLDLARSDYLLRHDPAVGPDDCAIVIVSDDWFRTGHPFPDGLTRPHRACWIALDRDDGTRLRTLEPAFRSFDFILRTHYNAATRYHENFVPWAYGLSERIVRATDAAAVRERRWEMLANWRHSAHPHSLRLDVERNLLPCLDAVIPVDQSREPLDDPPQDPRERLWWRETGRRHWPAYYQRLRSSAACACFGGFFVTPWPASKESLISRGLKHLLSLTHRRSHLIAQFDSWRLWESLVAGCATFHVDFERYGCVLPVMPTNWTHYIGVDLDSCDETVERLRADPAVLERIGAAGRSWALANYGPAATAARLLKLAGGAA